MEVLHSSVCRLCAELKSNLLRIYDDEGYKLSIGMKINKFLQIQVDEKDSLPKTICWECYTKLEQCSNFVNDSQNAQITLAQKIFVSYADEQSMKEENIYSQNTLFQQSENILGFNSQQIQKNDGGDEFDCSNLELPSQPTDCYYTSKPSDCLYEEGDKNLTHVEHISNNAEVNSDKLVHSCDEKKKFVKKKNVVNNRKNRKVVQKKKLIHGAKKKKTDLSDDSEVIYNEEYADILRDRYFTNIPWMCTECEENFQTYKELQEHHENFHFQSPRYMCPYCYKMYILFPGFVTHMKKYQCALEAVEFSCNKCSKTFNTKRTLEDHMIVHSDKRHFECKDCGKTFRRQCHLYTHSQCHAKKKYSCDVCDKSFSTKTNLLTHKKIHADQRSYICDLCGKGFVQKGNLCAHMLTHSDNKPFTCEMCNKVFKTHMQLQKHKNVHTGKKPHECDICGRNFRERGTLKEHYRIHTGAMPFSCEFCGKAFRFKGVLTTHKRQHTGERPYSCHDCQHYFTNWPNYNKHMKRRHGINKSKTSRMKPDSVPQTINQLTDNANVVNNNRNANIEIPTFEDTLEPVHVDSDKHLRLFDETTNDNHISSSYLLNHGTYDNISSVSQQQSSILSAYYNMPTIQVLNPNTNVVDIINGTIHREYW